MFEGIPETTIFYNPETACYGFSTRYPAQHVHHAIDTFESVERVLSWCDSHRERIWSDASDADETKILISRDYKPDTVGWRMAHLTLADLGAASSR